VAAALESFSLRRALLAPAPPVGVVS